jgi:lanosterol synthase
MPHAINGAANATGTKTTNGTYKRGTNGHTQKPIGVKSSANGDEKTDYTRWRLRDERGCQTWHYLQSEEEVKEWPQSAADRYFLGMETVRMILIFVSPSQAHKSLIQRHGLIRA